MKKLSIFIMVGIVSLIISGCDKNEKSSDTSSNITSTSSSSKNYSSISSPLEVLQDIWDTYEENEKFSASGGDFSEENNKTDAPGKYSIDDADALDAALAFPSASVTKIEDAASLVHMMNSNTFTGALYKVKDGENVSALALDIKSNIDKRQWMCGFPDKLIIASYENYIAVAFGEKNNVDTFKKKLLAIYPDFSIITDENITE